VAPAGSAARLVVLKFTEGGPATEGQVQLGLASLVGNGHTCQVRRTTGPGGPLGTLVGAAPLRGETTTAIPVATKGESLRVPRDMILTFQTGEPIYAQ
jgi:hypothetical protein